MTRISAVCGLALSAAILLSIPATTVEAQGLSARLAPEASSIWWASDVGLQDTRLFGGGLSLGFGRFVTLRGSYERANSVRTSLLGSGYGGGVALENSLDASLFSTGLQFRLGNGRIAPVLTGLGGVLAVSPDGRESARQVVVGYGGGLDARVTSWLDAQVLVQDLRFRMDRSSLAGDPGGGVPADTENGDLRRSTAVTASLAARLGGSRESTRSNELDQSMSRAYSGDGLMIPIELQVGVMRFADGLDIDDRGFAGARAGFDFGPYFGLRGSYARAVANDYGSLIGMTSWSGEGQFNLGRVTDLTPHLILGFGQLTFDDDFRNRSGVTPEDQNALIVGAGVGVPLNSRMRFIVTLRDHITSAGSASGVSSTADLRHNFGLSGGLSYLIRRGPVGPRPSPTASPSPLVSQDPPPTPTTDTAPAADQAPTVATAGAAQAPTTVTPAPAEVPVTTIPAPAPAAQAPPTAVVPPASAVTTPATVASDVASADDYQSDRTISIPVPRVGELYIRYGPGPQQASPTLPTVVPPTAQAAADTAGAPAAPAGAAVNQAQIADLVRAELERTAAASTALPDTVGRVTRTDLAALEERLAGRLAAISAPDTSGATTQASAQVSPELAALTMQVDELSRLVREGLGQNEGALIISGSTGDVATEVVNEMRAPFFRALEFRAGTSSVRNDGPGMGVALEASLGDRWADRLQPFAGLHLGQVSVNGQLGGSPFAGSVTSYGVTAGIQVALPDVRSISPAVSLGVSTVAGGSRGDTPAEATVIDDLYGGFVMGPRLAVTGGWSPSVGSPLQLVGSIAKLWAGSRGGWSFQTGLRWSRPSSMRTVVRPIVQAPITSPASSVPAASAPTQQAPAVADPSAAQVGVTDAALLSRLAELEASLQAEREARQRMELAADSTAAQSRVAQARADSLSRAAQARADSLSRAAQARADSLSSAAAAAERERLAAEESRAAFRRSLEALVGVVPDVQSVRSTERGLEVSLGGGIFPTGATALPSTARAQVERVARVLAQGPAQQLLVNGHTDSTGSAETNAVVSRLRAEAVRDVFVEAGIDASLITVLASGEDVPVADNGTQEGRSRNRRVEVVVLGFDAR